MNGVEAHLAGDVNPKKKTNHKSYISYKLQVHFWIFPLKGKSTSNIHRNLAFWSSSGVGSPLMRHFWKRSNTALGNFLRPSNYQSHVVRDIKYIHYTRSSQFYTQNKALLDISHVPTNSICLQYQTRHVYMIFRQNFGRKKTCSYSRDYLLHIYYIPRVLRKGNPFHGPFAQLLHIIICIFSFIQAVV